MCDHTKMIIRPSRHRHGALQNPEPYGFRIFLTFRSEYAFNCGPGHELEHKLPSHSQNLDCFARDPALEEYDVFKVLENQQSLREHFTIVLKSVSSYEYWVSYAEVGSLVYKTTPAGDRIMDFSAAGYMGKDAPIPDNIPVHVTLKPSNSNEDGVAIQQAINTVSSLPIDILTGFRGAIQLSSGTFDVRGHHFSITSSGVVIKGSPGTVLHASMDPNYAPLFAINGPEEKTTEVGSRAAIVSNVASGSDHVTLHSTSGLNSGDLVLIVWPQTLKWIEMMNMTMRWGNYSVTSIERTITKVDQEKNQVLLNIPVPFRIDLSYLDSDNQAYLVKISISGRINHVGLENFKAVQDKVAPNGGGSFLNMAKVQDSWVKNVIAVDFGGDTMTVTGKRITVDNLQLIRTLPGPPHGPKPADLAIAFPGSQILVKNSLIEGGSTQFNYMTRDGANGPNVFFNSTSYGTSSAQPHSHFATGLLYDTMNFPSGGSIDLIKREFAHHGYTSAYSVVWSSRASELTVINPPNAANWAIGCSSKSAGNIGKDQPGFIDPHGIQSAKLSSLYLAQKAAAKFM